MEMEKYYIKTRGIRLKKEEAVANGIRRVYNYTSDMDFMGHCDMKEWIRGMKEREEEVVLVESAVKMVKGVPIYVSTGIVFLCQEMSNIFYMKNRDAYVDRSGFLTIMN